MKKQIYKHWQSSLLATITIILAFGAFSASLAQEKKLIGGKYGTRELPNCEDKTAPTKGALTAALAEKYVNCKHETIIYGDLYLLEDVKVQVGAGRPYNSITDSLYTDIDVTALIYPLRGSYVQYQCSELSADNAGKNCTKYIHRKAEGRCVKTSFGDWDCYLQDVRISDDDKFFRVPPPKNDKTVTKGN